MSGATAAIRSRRNSIEWTRFLQDFGVYIGVAALIVFNTAQLT